MSKLYEIIEKPLAGEWGSDDELGIGVPVLRTTNFTNSGVVDYTNVVTRIIDEKKVREKYLRLGDIIIEKSGGSPAQPVGRVVYFEGEDNKYLFNNFTSVLRLKDPDMNCPKYVFYHLFGAYKAGKTRKFQNKTTGISNLKLDRFVKDMDLLLPLLETQKQIAKTLDTVAELLGMRKQQLAELDNLIKSTFYDMFGDPLSNRKSFPVKNLEDIAIKQKNAIVDGPFGSSLKMSDYYDEGIPIIRINNIRDEGFYNNEFKYILESKYLELNRSKVVYNDILIARVGNTIGKTCVFDQHYRALLSTTGVAKVTLDTEISNVKFIIQQLRLPRYITYIWNQAEGGGQPYLNLTKIKQFKILLPPIVLQNEFASIVTKIEEQKTLVKKAIDETQYLFDSLMSEYFE